MYQKPTRAKACSKLIKLLFLFFILMNTYVAKSQRYNLFTYNKLYGISDSNATEIIAPLYDWKRSLSTGEYVFHPPIQANMPVLKFNMQTGEKKYFDTYYTDEVSINGLSYSFVKDKKQVLFNT